MEWALAQPALAGKPIVYTPGNHEFYRREIEASLRAGKEAATGTRVRLLDRDIAVIDGDATLGGTAKAKSVRFIEKLAGNLALQGEEERESARRALPAVDETRTAL